MLKTSTVERNKGTPPIAAEGVISPHGGDQAGVPSTDATPASEHRLWADEMEVEGEADLLKAIAASQESCSDACYKELQQAVLASNVRSKRTTVVSPATVPEATELPKTAIPESQPTAGKPGTTDMVSLFVQACLRDPTLYRCVGDHLVKTGRVLVDSVRKRRASSAPKAKLPKPEPVKANAVKEASYAQIVGCKAKPMADFKGKIPKISAKVVSAAKAEEPRVQPKTAVPVATSKLVKRLKVAPKGVVPFQQKCWNCQVAGHRYSQCPVKTLGDFCRRCGRKGKTLATCSHCSAAWRAEGPYVPLVGDNVPRAAVKLSRTAIRRAQRKAKSRAEAAGAKTAEPRKTRRSSRKRAGASSSPKGKVPPSIQEKAGAQPEAMVVET